MARISKCREIKRQLLKTHNTLQVYIFILKEESQKREKEGKTMMFLTVIPNDFAAVTLVGSRAASTIGALLFLAVMAAKYMLFIKMGEEGWKSLIPFYNRYLLYKKCWDGSYYFAALSMIIPTVILGVSSYIIYTGGYGYSFGIVLGVLAMITAAIPFVMNLILAYKISKAFGHGLLFTAGYVLMTDIFTLILGFGDDKYQPVTA